MGAGRPGTGPARRPHRAAPARRRHLAAAAGSASRREPRHSGAGVGRGGLRDGRGVRLRRLARRLRLPAAQRPGLRPAGPRPDLPGRALPRAQRPCAPARAHRDPGDGHPLRGVGPVGAGPVAAARPARCALVRLPAGVPAPRPDAPGLLRRLRRDVVPRALRHRPRHLGLAGARPHRADRHRQPAERHRGWLLLLRRGGSLADAAHPGALLGQGRHGPGQRDHRT